MDTERKVARMRRTSSTNKEYRHRRREREREREREMMVLPVVGRDEAEADTAREEGMAAAFSISPGDRTCKP